MSNSLCLYIGFDYHHDMEQINKFFMPYVHLTNFGLDIFIHSRGLESRIWKMLIIELFAILFTLPIVGIRSMIREIQRSIIVQFRYQMYTKLPHHLQHIIMAQGPVIDKVHHFDVMDDQFQEAVDALLDKSQIKGQHDVTSIPIFPAFRSSSFSIGFFWGASGG